MCLFIINLTTFFLFTDLLNGSGNKDKLDIRQTPDGNQVIGLSEVEVCVLLWVVRTELYFVLVMQRLFYFSITSTLNWMILYCCFLCSQISSMDHVRELMKQGQANRAVGSHDMNEHSSRSHSILTIVARGRNLIDNTTSYGKLCLCFFVDVVGAICCACIWDVFCLWCWLSVCMLVAVVTTDMYDCCVLCGVCVMWVIMHCAIVGWWWEMYLKRIWRTCAIKCGAAVCWCFKI